VNRSDFRELAELHLQHAKALLDAQLYSGAYYVCGYVVGYEPVGRKEAEDLLTAVSDPVHGVLTCIKPHW
jgi:hypothetical protein